MANLKTEKIWPVLLVCGNSDKRSRVYYFMLSTLARHGGSKHLLPAWDSFILTIIKEYDTAYHV